MKIDHEGMNDHSEDETESEANTPQGHIDSSPFGVFISADSEEERSTENFTTSSGHKTENKIGIRKTLSSKADEWMAKKRNVWPWKGNVERDVESLNVKLGYFGWQQDQLCQNTTSTSSSKSSSKSKAIIKVEKETDNVDYEILWEDLITKEQIGQGSCGTVYHGLCQQRLRHPNILLFMGAVTSPQHLGIVTEFLPRGSLFQVLQKNSTQLDWRRRLHMAMDIARGMNYLHQYNPPIVHRDLKSSNLLVDKNWSVKVGDFGLSRIRHQTYLKTKGGKGTVGCIQLWSGIVGNYHREDPLG
nr:hypothetical protein [Tanacetum cinerariifolium]